LKVKLSATERADYGGGGLRLVCFQWGTS